MEEKRLFTIAVEGNIGSGKSTFLSQFSHLPNVDVLTEPIDKWCNVDGQYNLLQLMYENPERHSLTFQSYVQLTMTQLHVAKPTSDLVDLKVMERSLFSSRHCFVENLWRSGKLAPSEFGVLCEWYNFLTSDPNIDLGVDLIVYLRTTPETAWQRVKARSRPEEKVIPIEYLRDLHNLHEEWLMTSQNELPAKVIVINVDTDLQTRPDFYQEIVKKVMKEIAERRSPSSTQPSAASSSSSSTSSSASSSPRKRQSPFVIMSPIKACCLSPSKAIIVQAAN